MNVTSMKKDEKTFISILYIITVVLLLLALAVVYVISIKSISSIRIILILLSIVFIGVSITILLSTIIIYKIMKNKKISKFQGKFIQGLMNNIYPLLLSVSKIVGTDIDSIRRVFAKINNFLVMTKTINVSNEELLILLPHCLQNSQCNIKITNDITNCKKCGKCDINYIVDLCDKYKIDAIVATGGTLAREWIKRKQPKAIIAVACERDLSSGINDVKLLPVLGVINERPNGPCFDTRVNIHKLEDAIKFFLKED